MEKQMCINDGCEGNIEATAKVYLDAQIDEDGKLHLEFSGLNDKLDGHPVALEGELSVTCDEGCELGDWAFSEETRQRISPQPIGPTND